MLVLSRQLGEKVYVVIPKGTVFPEDVEIEVTVVDIRGDKVRLGFDAPIEIPVHRKEVYDAIKREKLEAAEVKAEVKAPAPATVATTEANVLEETLRQRQSVIPTPIPLTGGFTDQELDS